MKLMLSKFRGHQAIRVQYKQNERFIVVFYASQDMADVVKEAMNTALSKQVVKEVGAFDIKSITIESGDD